MAVNCNQWTGACTHRRWGMAIIHWLKTIAICKMQIFGLDKRISWLYTYNSFTYKNSEIHLTYPQVFFFVQESGGNSFNASVALSWPCFQTYILNRHWLRSNKSMVRLDQAGLVNEKIDQAGVIVTLPANLPVTVTPAWPIFSFTSPAWSSLTKV